MIYDRTNIQISELCPLQFTEPRSTDFYPAANEYCGKISGSSDLVVQVLISEWVNEADSLFLRLCDINGNEKSHFYTPIYNGSLDSNNKLRSISGQTVIKSKTASQEMTYARANGTGYEIEQYVDRLLINILLIFHNIEVL